jgi:hypothetical protein
MRAESQFDVRSQYSNDFNGGCGLLNLSGTTLSNLVRESRLKKMEEFTKELWNSANKRSKQTTPTVLNARVQIIPPMIAIDDS